MKKAGWPVKAVFGLWLRIVFVAIVAAVLGAALMTGVSGDVRGVALAFAVCELL